MGKCVHKLCIIYNQKEYLAALNLTTLVSCHQLSRQVLSRSLIALCNPFLLYLANDQNRKVSYSFPHVGSFARRWYCRRAHPLVSSVANSDLVGQRVWHGARIFLLIRICCIT